MAEIENTPRTKKRVWARTRFDLEGIAGAAAAIFIGILLGWLWSPLFLIGLLLAVLILMATRKRVRVAPALANIVVAPCDGIVHSIRLAHPPTELRLNGGERLRLRISSSPSATNPLYASITGEIASVILEEPDMSVLLAGQPDLPGLAVAHIALESLGQQVGYTVSTGGFGPRLEVVSEAGDPVRLGRVIGKRRLGGWCDVYLPAGAKLLVSEGQTLIGSETVLCRLVGGDTAAVYPETAENASTVVVEEKATEVEIAEEPLEAEPETSLEEIGEDVANTPSASSNLPERFLDEDGDITDPEEAASELFKKLKDEAERSGEP